METIGDNLFQVKKERSFVSCLVKGNSYGFKHLGFLLRYIWPSLILASLLPIPFICFYAGQIDAILRKWVELGYLPNVTLRTLKDDILRCSVRNLINLLLFFLYVLILSAIIILPFFLGYSFWWGALFMTIVAVIVIPGFSAVSMQISYSENPISKSIAEGLNMGYKNFGQVFGYELLLFLMVFPVYIIACIPNFIVAGVCTQAFMGYQMGDVIDLPLLFPLLAYLSFVIFMAIMLVTYLVVCFSRCLMWGSLVNEVPTEAEANS
jgi:hypothetical protein